MSQSLSDSHLALLDSIPTAHIPHALKAIPPPPNAPPEIASKPFYVLVCKPHGVAQCTECALDFTPVNYMYQFLRMAPQDAVPPPPNVAPPPQKAQQITNLKEAGNNAFKAQKFDVANQFYSKAADMALSRAPWEPSSVSREEAAVTLCNRSASHAFMGHWAGALSDAEAVIALKRPWTKGHFRKARALLGLGRLEDARQAIVDGMQYEPLDKELNAFLVEIERKIREADAEFPDTL